MTNAIARACLDENTIQALVSGAVSVHEGEAIDEHLDGCVACRMRLADLSRALVSSPLEAASDPMTLRAGAVFGRYRLVEPLGCGATGVVYAAHDTVLDRKVALKLLRKDASGVANPSRILREAKAIARLSHPNVVAVHDAGALDGEIFVAMELLEGGTLREALARGDLSVEARLSLFAQAGEGLAAAHAAGLVHRDFKPDNVLLGRDGRPRVCDFGLARPVALDESAARPDATEVSSPEPDLATTVTRTGTLLGTPAYMAPEQLRGERADARADVFSFSVALHEALYGARPFSGRTLGELRADIESKPRLAPPRAPDVPRRLGAAIARGLRADPAERTADMRELLRELTLESVGRRLTRAVAIVAGAVVLLAGAGGALRASGGRPSPSSAAPSTARAVRLQRVTANPRENHIHRGTISPDGTRLAFGDTRGLHVRTIDPPSTRDLPLAPGEQAQFMSFYPDGVRLMAVVARAGAAELAVFDLESGARSVFPGAAVEAHAVPSVSPDGARLALSSGGHRSGGRIAVAPAGGGPFEVVAELHGHAFAMAWSPKGRSIAYVEEEEGSPPLLRTVDTVTGEKRTLLSDDHLRQETGLSALAWLADGRLVFTRAEWLPQEPGTNLYAMPVDDAGRALAEPARVTDWTNLVVGDLSAARTGRIALTRHQMQADVYVGALSGDGRTLGPTRRLTMSDRNERASGFSADGKTVLLMSDRNGRYDVFEHALTGEDDALVGADAAAWSTWAVAAPDGAMLFWRLATSPQARPAHPLLVRKDLAGARVIYTAPEEEVAGVLGRPPPISRVRCSARSCFLSRFEADDFVLYEISPSSGLGREVYRRRRSLPLEWDVSRDGSRVALPIDGRVLELISTDTGARELLTIPMYAESVAWLPSGTGLVATGFDAPLTMSTVRRVDLAGGAVPLVTQEGVWFAHPQISPDGATLAYSMKAYDDDLWIVDGL